MTVGATTTSTTVQSVSTNATLAPSTTSAAAATAPGLLLPRRSVSPGEKTQYCSTSGLDIEAQIADGGGVAAMRGLKSSPPPASVVVMPVPVRSTASREESIPMVALVSRCFVLDTVESK
jgi:hypothetical protein